MKEDWKDFIPVSREKFFSTLNCCGASVAVVSLYTGSVYYIIKDIDALRAKAVKFGFRFDKRDLRSLVEAEFYYVNKDFSQMKDDLHLSLDFANEEDKKCKICM